MPVLFTALLLSEVLYVCLLLISDLRTHLPFFFLTWFCLVLVWLGGIWFFRSQKIISTQIAQWIILGGALLFRFTLLPSIPSLSDDIFRYSWEGRMQRAGINPVQFAPDHPMLEPFRNEIYPHINHKHIASIYPTLTQWQFRLSTYVSDGFQWLGMSFFRAEVVSQKLGFVFWDVMTLLLMMWWLTKIAAPLWQVLLYAWNPLVILEFAGSGHNDSLGIFWLVAGVLGIQLCESPLFTKEGVKGEFFNKSFCIPFLLAASFLSKYLAILMWPYLFWKKQWTLLFGTLAVSIAGLFLFFQLPGIPTGPSTYTMTWSFNGFFYALLETGFSPMTSKMIAVGMCGTLIVFLAQRMKDVVIFVMAALLAVLVFSPTVYPWYFIWVLPFICLRPSIPFVVWNITIVLSYWVHHVYAQTGRWELSVWVWLAEYVPVVLAWFWAKGFLRTKGAAI